MPDTMTNRERFLTFMEYKPLDRLPHYEVGVWPQTIERWKTEGLDESQHSWDWFTGDPAINLDYREYIPIHYDMVPWYDYEVLEKNEKYEVIRDHKGVVRRALLDGTVHGGRMSMDTYLSFPVQDVASFRKMVSERYDPHLEMRYPANWRENMVKGWREREHVLVLGRNCTTLGFYWRAREWMGTENLSYALCLDPELMHEMMSFVADLTIEISRPILEQTDVDYIFINEDMAMKTGPLIGPEHYREYIFPHMKRLVDFHKSHGVKYVVVDSDGNPEPLIPLLMEAGVDAIWPMERASENTNPAMLRKKYGKQLRLWGGVDKRELTKDFKAIDDHLMTLASLIEEGGFVPTVDHTVPPDISLANFLHYNERKQQLLRGDFW